MNKESTPQQASGPKKKNCPRCGSHFTCGAATGKCWCQDFPPLKHVDPSADCLCPKCLAEATKKNQ